MGENSKKKTPEELLTEVLQILKTAHPFLVLSMEAMVESILHRLKPFPDEDTYRVLSALLDECILQTINQMTGTGDVKSVISTAERFALSIYVQNSNFKEELEKDLIHDKPTIEQLVVRFQKWRNRFDCVLGI